MSDGRKKLQLRGAAYEKQAKEKAQQREEKVGSKLPKLEKFFQTVSILTPVRDRDRK